MNKNKRKLYASLIALVVLALIAYITAKQAGVFDEKITTNNSPYSEFAVADTTTINKFVITKSTGETATLSKNSNGHWMINNKHKAKPESVSLILRTFKNINVKSRVGAAAHNNIIKNIAGYHRKIEIYNNGELTKTWYVGNPTSDRQGTYMLLETPDLGKSKEPFIMELAAFHGQLDVRFFTEEEEWKYTGIFNYKPEEITEIKLVSNELPQDGFTLKNQKDGIVLLDHNGGKVRQFDTLTTRSYLYNYKKVHYEHGARMLTVNQIDSLKSAKPFVELTVVNTKKYAETLKIYRMPNFAKVENIEGEIMPYNPERAYVILPGGDIVVVQYYVFDKLLRSIRSFIRNPAAS